MEKNLGSLVEETALSGFNEEEMVPLPMFSEEERQRAKKGIPYVTLLYIEQLEQVSRNACQVWEHVVTALNTNPHSRLEEVRYEFLRSLNSFYESYEQVGFLLPESSEEDE